MDLLITIFSLAILLFSVIIHELAHGSVAYSLGDPTAKYEGRLTMNPLKHLDPFGSVILPALLILLTGGQGPVFGWAKPVPVNPYNLRGRWGQLKVALAGPAVNILVALVFGLIIRFLPISPALPFVQFLSLVVLYNFMLAFFNLLPIPPLDGSWILFHLLPESANTLKVFLEQYGFFLLIFLIFFDALGWLNTLVEILFRLVTGI